MKTKKNYPLDQSALYCCRSTAKLAEKLHTNKSILRKIERHIKYREFDQSKKNGNGTRHITAPSSELKKLQKRVYQYLRQVRRPEWLMAGEIGKSWVTNGQRHQDANYLLKFDIRDFFPNCKREYVFQFFSKTMRMPNDIASILASICTYDGAIVSGSPTSLVISYYAYQKMYEELSGLAENYNLTFTVYVDDLTFSSKFPIPKFVVQRVAKILIAYGHKLRLHKVKYYGKNSPKMVTGSVITPNHELTVPNHMRKNIVQGLFSIKNSETISKLKQKKQLRTLQGRLIAAKAIDYQIFPQISHFTEQNLLVLKNKKF